MQDKTLEAAVAEAEAFITAVEDLRLVRAMIKAGHPGLPSSAPKQQGAVMRASMELTRKLADLRQGR